MARTANRLPAASSAAAPSRGGQRAEHAWLERVYRQYHQPRFIRPDPLQTLGAYSDPADREVIGLVAALLAYGNVKAILGGIAEVERRLGPRPAAWLDEHTPEAVLAAFADYRYRVTAGRTLGCLLVSVRTLRRQYGSLDHAATAAARRLRETPETTHHAPAAPTGHDPDPALTTVAAWVELLHRHAPGPLDHLLPHPGRGSACKRLWLYLRWMVRRDAIDPGGWSALCPADLIVPLDTHMHRIARARGWTRRKQANLAAAREVTAALARHCPTDPLRYDFALTRPGIRREQLPGGEWPIVRGH